MPQPAFLARSLDSVTEAIAQGAHVAAEHASDLEGDTAKFGQEAAREVLKDKRPPGGAAWTDEIFRARGPATLDDLHLRARALVSLAPEDPPRSRGRAPLLLLLAAGAGGYLFFRTGRGRALAQKLQGNVKQRLEERRQRKPKVSQRDAQPVVTQSVLVPRSAGRSVQQRGQ